MPNRAAEILDLERKVHEARSMAKKSPFAKDRQRFTDIAVDYQRRADQLRRQSSMRA